MKEERRYFERKSLNLPLLLKIGKSDAALEGETKDLGAKGLGVFSKDKIPSAGAVKLRIEIPKQFRYLDLEGNVVWSKEHFPAGWRAGVALKEQAINLVTFAVLLDMLK